MDTFKCYNLSLNSDFNCNSKLNIHFPRLVSLMNSTRKKYYKSKESLFLNDCHLSTSRHIHTLNGSRDFNRSNHSIFIALLLYILQDVFIFLLIPQLLRCYHIQETQHLQKKLTHSVLCTSCHGISN